MKKTDVHIFVWGAYVHVGFFIRASRKRKKSSQFLNVSSEIFDQVRFKPT